MYIFQKREIDVENLIIFNLTQWTGSSKAKRKLASDELARNAPEFLADSMEKALSGVKVEEAEETTTSLLLPPQHAEGRTRKTSSSWRSCCPKESSTPCPATHEISKTPDLISWSSGGKSVVDKVCDHHSLQHGEHSPSHPEQNTTHLTHEAPD